MTERLIGETGSKKRRRFLFVPIALVACLALFVVAGAQAVHDETFQLDGNTTVETATQTVDWNSLFNASGGTVASLPPGYSDAHLVRDFATSGTGAFVTSDGTTFATGSKDTLPISGWQCNFDNNVNSKIDVTNSYATTYTDPGGDEFIYFGIERNVNTGTANVGFWFLQDEVGCSSTAGTATFTGAHLDGDLLVVSEFSGGGTVSTINAYRWDRPSAAGPLGSLNPTPIAAGVDCRGGNVGTNDATCGAANTGTIPIQWLTAQKTTVGHSLGTALFFEAGLNLTKSGLGGKCFSTFLGDTRSSTSLTATLFDFSGGTLGKCDSGVVTTPSVGKGGSAPIGANGTLSVTDSAVLTVSGADTYGGTMTFHLCGPTPAADPYAPCTTGGTPVPAVKTVTGTSSTTTVVSDAYTITSAGKYCWRADYSGDATAGVPASSDSSVDECFTVTPLQPAITTNATGAAGVPLGSAISDSATLSGATSNAGGSITFRVYGPDNATCSGTAAFTGSATVSGNGTYSSGSFTPTAAGTYRWIASYSGDLPNTLAVAGSCGDANEASVINPRQPAIVTNATGAAGVPLGTAISDSATLSNTAPRADGSPAGGTITFRVYGPDNATCTGTAAFTSAAVPVSGNGTYSSGSFTPTAAGTYRWIATYSGDAPNTLGVAGSCGDANEASVIISLTPTIATAQSFVPNDSATITVASGGGNLAGNVVFKLYVNDASCAGTAAYTSAPIAITSGSGGDLSKTVLSNNGTSYGTTGTTFNWVVTYTSTNPAHQNVTSGCAKESSSITVQNNG